MSLLSKIFRKKEKLIKFDYSLLQTDMHSHLIPAIDDGSRSIDDSLFLIQGLADLGYKNIVTTPHTMSDYYKNTLEIINAGLQTVQKAVAEKGINVTINAASEYYVDFDFIQKIGNEKLLTFGDNYILIEFSFANPPQNIHDVIFELQTNGYKPVLAHPERYLYWSKNLQMYESFRDKDVLLQTNLLSLAGMYSPEAKHIAEYLVNNDMADFLGTDMHNSNHLKWLQNLHVKESIAKKIADHKWINPTIIMQ